jgi:membrane-associated protease RseP (regulator of RpoE activity)
VKILKLAEQSAGLVAGLQVGDILLDLNGEPIMTAERLVQAYAAIGADEYVEFSAVRNTRLVSARVTFGEWNELER